MIWRLLHWQPKEQVRLLQCITKVYLANIVHTIHLKRGSDSKDGHVGTHSPPLVLRKSIGQSKLPAKYHCVKCVCVCLCNRNLDTLGY